MKKFCKVLTLTTIVALAFGLFGTANAVVIGGAYQVDLLSVNYDAGTNLQNWTYRITGLENPGVSHIVIEFAEICDPPLSTIDSAGGQAQDIEISIDYTDADPTTGKVGIKYENFDTADGSIEAGETVDIWFTLVGEWPVGTIEVWIKAANNVNSGVVDGPECRIQNQIPEIPLGTVMAASSMVIALGAYVVLQKRGKN